MWIPRVGCDEFDSMNLRRDPVLEIDLILFYLMFYVATSQWLMNKIALIRVLPIIAHQVPINVIAVDYIYIDLYLYSINVIWR